MAAVWKADHNREKRGQDGDMHHDAGRVVPGEGVDVPFTTPDPQHLLHPAVPELHPFIINQ